MTPRRLSLAWLPFTFLAVAAAAPEPPAPLPVDLRYQLPVATTLTYQTKISGEGTIEALGETLPITITGAATLVQRTTAVSDKGEISLETTAKSVTITRALGTGEETTKSLPTITEVITPRGKLVKSSGFDGSQPGLSALGSWGVQRLLSQTRPPAFPDRPVAVGESWGGKETIEIAGDKVEIQRQSKLVEIKTLRGHTCAVIESTIELPINVVTPPDPLGIVTTIKGTQKVTDTTYFDFDKGLIVSRSGVVDFAFTTETKIPGQGAANVVPATTRLALKIDTQLKD